MSDMSDKCRINYIRKNPMFLVTLYHCDRSRIRCHAVSFRFEKHDCLRFADLNNIHIFVHTLIKMLTTPHNNALGESSLKNTLLPPPFFSFLDKHYLFCFSLLVLLGL